MKKRGVLYGELFQEIHSMAGLFLHFLSHFEFGYSNKCDGMQLFKLVET